MNNESNPTKLPLFKSNKPNNLNQSTTLQNSSIQFSIDPISKDRKTTYNRNVRQATNTNLNQSKWYAVYTKSRFEKKLYMALKKSGFNVFLPMVKEKRVWGDRIKTVTVPLLPSYLFIKLPKNNNHLIYSYTGFVRFVSFEGKCSEINEKEIGLLKKIELHGLTVEKNSNNFHTGDLVKVVKGPLIGCEGRIDRKKGSRVIFQLESIHQCVSVELCSSFIKRVIQ